MIHKIEKLIYSVEKKKENRMKLIGITRFAQN